ncbi:Sec23-binding domain of Sec16-domain-containing protein [Thermothelomyces heterothallicus CBS 202.75]|uniref:Sec23-binding domain of Sec16-domain-containing protein n=1 Tax=Thermothelomyces heterothallicus CBS 202.75 TaxID=1149848 RepID=UPI0037426B9E
MVSDAPNPTWHPAMMPNSTADLPQSRAEETASSPAQEPSNAENTAQPDATGEASQDWFQDDGAGDDWLADTTKAPAASAETPEQTEQATPTESADDALPDESSTASKHFSTMSFTRTVAHEVNWNDDDDAEWTLSRTDSDPFKFMPESNRTNSFPPVSPPESRQTETPRELGQPISFSSAEDLIREVKEETREDEPLPDATTGTSQGDAGAQETGGGTAERQHLGESTAAPSEEEARFEEGIPLVSSAQQDGAPQSPGAAGHDLFAQEADDEKDDFFSNVRAEGATQGGGGGDDDSQPAPVQRKSTMDVLKSVDVESAGTSFTHLDETAEESQTENDSPPQPKESNEELPAQSPEKPRDEPEAQEEEENLDEKWRAMFGDDDEEGFLPDDGAGPNEVDASAFLGSDDEGLLEDSETEQPDQSQPATTSSAKVPTTPSYGGTQAVNNRYLPQSQTPAVTAPPPNPYLPAASPLTPANPYVPAAQAPAVQPPAPASYIAPSTAPPTPMQSGYGAAPPPLPTEKKAQSFVDKSKGGYTSPYDLPMEVVKVPKRRTSAQPLQRNTSAPGSPAPIPPPPRSASMHSSTPPPPPSGGPPPGMARPASSHSSRGPPSGRKTESESFFEDLPITTKPRPASRQSQKSTPSPTQPSSYGVPLPSAPPSVTSHPMPPPPPPRGSSAPGGSGPGIPELVAPPRVNPYAPLSSSPAPVPAAPPVASTRYSPAPPGAPHPNGPVPAPATNRYSPAPPASRPPTAGYAPAPATPGPVMLPHQPRTSSPLAQFEITHERSRSHAPVSQPEGNLGERRSSSSLHEYRLQRVPSLPPTREVEEEEAPKEAQGALENRAPPYPASPPVSRYAPPPQGARQTPPPPGPSGQAVLSPPKRAASAYSPLAPPYEFVPPPRSQTQSPGSLYGNRGAKSGEPIPRPSSVNDPTSPREVAQSAATPPQAFAPVAPAAAPAAAPATTANTTYRRPRGASMNLNVIPPTDGREHDPLQRWRGAPIISWGVGGTFVTMFPKEVPRYGMNQSIPAVVRSPGDVKVQNIKDILPLEERLAKFPGPLKGKSKKKETIAWLTAGIESLERSLPTSFSFQTNLSHDQKRAVERVLLWKILRVFVEHDGVLEGNPAVDKAVRDILTPGLEGPENSATPFASGGAAFGLAAGSAPSEVQAEGVGSSTLEQIRRHLLVGEHEKAVWAAADQRLWGHALLISNALAPNLYRQVAQEFVKKEVNIPGHNNESLAALYGVLSGNHEESVDELVPSHARAGLQLMATNPASGPSKDALEGLDKWRETLSLILSNRSLNDVRAIHSLGILLSGYGRAEAAHICFMFARSFTVFGGLDDPASHFVLVGSDHKKQAEQFTKEIEPLLLSEVYEYGQSLAGGSPVPVTNPHLAAYKLEHALALAEYGFRDKALQYCDAIAAAITAQTKRSPYHHPILENAVEDLMRRLKQAPKEDSGSWIPKPTMNKVSDTVWSKFNKFVSGEDDTSGQGTSGEAEPGPFARVAGGTPAISRSPSTNNLETFGAVVPSYGIPAALPNGPVPASAPPTRAASRYAPGAPQCPASNSRPSTSAYAPRSSMERTSSELNRSSFEVPRRSLELQSGRTGSYSPVRSGSPAAMYTPQGVAGSSSPPQQSPYSPASQPAPPQPIGYPGAAVNGESPDKEPDDASAQSPESSGYPAPSYGYEPPSLTPYEAPAEDKSGTSEEAANGNSSTYEPPSYQPYSYEPPSYEPDPEPSNEDAGSDEESKPKPKKKGIMYDDEDDFPIPRPAEKTKEEKDRENEELIRKVAEEDAKRAEAAKQTKKGWGFTSWFGVGAKKDAAGQSSSPNKPIRAKLGEANSFYYDPELKRWVNKNAGPEDAAKKATPPPPRAAPGTAQRSVSASPASPPSSSTEAAGRASAPSPPTGPPRAASRGPTGNGAPAGPPPPGPAAMLRSASSSSTASAPPLGQGAPPSRPPTSLSNSNSIDDLLGAAGPRKPGAAKKARKGARYVDVMGKS